MASYGLLVAGVFGSLTWVTLQDDPSPARATPPHGVQEDDAYAEAPKSGYVPTYFDGGGGIAGVPLTEEQRKALIAEARRRGMPIEEAYALAYGDGVRIDVHKDGTVHVDTSGVKVPTHPVYIRTVAPPAGPPKLSAWSRPQARTAVAPRSPPGPPARAMISRWAQGKSEKPAKAEEKSGKAKPKTEGA
jgi:hypothetical protein